MCPVRVCIPTVYVAGSAKGENTYTRRAEREREKIARGDLFLRPMSARRPAVVLAE